MNNEDTLKKLAEALRLDAAKLRSLRPKRKIKQKIADQNTFSGFLTLQRVEWGLTQLELANLVKIKPSVVMRIEKGTYKETPSKHRDVMDMLFKFFKCQRPANLMPLCS